MCIIVPPGWKKESPLRFARVVHTLVFAISLRYCFIGGGKKNEAFDVVLNVLVFILSPATT